MSFDYIIEDATIYDGTGRVAYRNDVGILGDRIGAIGNLSAAQAAKRIPAGSRALCPGFVDIHSHADMTLHRPDHPKYLEPLVRQGITTFVGGNCGVSLGPISDKNDEHQFTFYEFFIGEDQRPVVRWKSFGDLLDHYESQGCLLNAAMLVGHGILRMDAMGDSMQRALPHHIETMKKSLSAALEEGAVGLSTGLQYFPGNMSDDEELTELAKVVHQYSGVFTSHLRSYNSDTIGKAADEIIGIGRKAEVPVQMSHLFWVPNFPEPLNRISKVAIKGLSYLYNKHPFPLPIDSGARPILDKVGDLVRQGYPIGIDAMPTTAGFTHLIAFFPPWSLTGGGDAVKRRVADPVERRKIRESIEKGDSAWPHRGPNSWSMNFFKVMGWDCAFVMSVKSEKNRHLVGKTFVEIGEMQGKHPFDAACDLLLEEDGKVLIFETATYPGDPMIELSLLGTLLDPNVSVVTDTILLGYGRPSHLFYDCFPKFLGNYSREGRHIDLEEAIRKCTSLPAKQLQIKDRGVVREGAYADLVLFDPRTIRTNSTESDPAHFPSGVDYVFINGKAVLDPEGFHPEPRPGRILRRGAM